MAIYTKTGDKGRTSLVGGERVSKTDCRLEAYGTIDELSAHVAHLRDSMNECPELMCKMMEEKEELLSALSLLMNASSILASEKTVVDKMPKIEESDIENLEMGIDRMTEQMPKIFKFTIPGGHSLNSKSHIARTVCRRAERAVLIVNDTHGTDELVIRFINRLSDYLYTLGRSIMHNLGIEESYWRGKN